MHSQHGSICSGISLTPRAMHSFPSLLVFSLFSLLASTSPMSCSNLPIVFLVSTYQSPYYQHVLDAEKFILQQDHLTRRMNVLLARLTFFFLSRPDVATTAQTKSQSSDSHISLSPFRYTLFSPSQVLKNLSMHGRPSLVCPVAILTSLTATSVEPD